MKSSEITFKKKLIKKVSKNTSPPVKENKKNPFTVVAIGASAGGLEAVTQLLRYIPADTGMAFIYVQHLSPNHKSFLTSILSKITKMKVQEIQNMEHMAPNNLYVIPNNKEIKVIDGHIQLLLRRKSIRTNLSIDFLFSSLAETHKENVIGVILSGNANDGTLGLKAIKDAGGKTFAQDDSAQALSMPKSAIASGVVDYVLSPKEIAAELSRLSMNSYVGADGKLMFKADAVSDDDYGLKIIFELLHKKRGVDFSHYKIPTIKRRLNNRILQSGVKTIKEYADLLIKDNKAIDLLYKDLLINVTSFFRDTEVFGYLKTSLLPKLLKPKISNEELRIWVPACSTGEEAYSIAMLIIELQYDNPSKMPVRIFATDLSEQAIRVARMGEYPESSMKGISRKNIERFFTKKGDNYCISKEVREMCVFAPHNILRDPPFLHIDFISCRNLLIYFDLVAQKKILATLHYALDEGKYLMLGKSETTGVSSPFFTQVNKKIKIYSRKKDPGMRKIPELASYFPRTDFYDKKINPSPKNIHAIPTGIDSAIDSLLLSSYMPACAVINKEMEILQFRGLTSLYLTHPPGKASLNILKMTRPEFAFELRDAILKVIKTNQPECRSGIEIKVDSVFRLMSLEVRPLKIDWDEPLLFIVFTLREKVEHYSKDDNDKKNNSALNNSRLQKMTEELNSLREAMNSVIESQEIAFQELQASNEEIVSNNEEFQTLNEELETSKEETEATNEELIATNQELKTHNQLLAESYNYSQTIIATIHEPLIILDSNLHVKSANQAFYKKFILNKEDIEGKPFFELSSKQWKIPKLHELLNNILSKNSHFENFEVTHVFSHVGKKTMLLNASRIVQKTHKEKLILLAIEDITELFIRQQKEKELLEENIQKTNLQNEKLEKVVEERTEKITEINESLRKKNEELERSNKELQSFAYVSGHDLQEPLRKMGLFASRILEKEYQNLSAEGKDNFNRIQSSAQRMKTLIEDLLLYSQTSGDECRFEKTDLLNIVKAVKAELADAIREKHAIIHTRIMCKTRIIPFQFRQLMLNLISNALKFSNPEHPPQIFIKSKVGNGSKLSKENTALLAEKISPQKKYCHISIADNGIGFEPHFSERIFEVFQRLHGKEEYTGTGIGLAIVKKIIDIHHGIITATSELNKGATFDIYIPVS